MTDTPGQPGRDTVPWRAFYAEARTRLQAAGTPSAEVDARRIVEQASGFEGADFHQGLDELATERGVVLFDAMLVRRLAGEPLQYVLGRWGFRLLDLLVDQRVLIPRPETEIVTEVALRELDRLAETLGSGDKLVAADLGTGSGAIGLSIAAERADTEVILTDRSPEALAVARANLAGLGSAGLGVRICEGPWFDALPINLVGRINLIVSNPPYVAASDVLPTEVSDWEPLDALIAGPQGTEDVEHILAGAPTWLGDGGSVVVEMAPHHVASMIDFARSVGLVGAEVVVDLAGRERAVVARWHP